MAAASLTWLGHASFRLDSPGGKRIYVDPWLDNPKCPANEKDPERCDVIAVTHGHSDHLGSVVAITEKLGPMPIVALVELKGWLKAQGAQTDDVPGPNKGGTVTAEGPSSAELEWNAFVSVNLMPSTATVPPLFGPGTSSVCAPCPLSQPFSSTIATIGIEPSFSVIATTEPRWSEWPCVTAITSQRSGSFSFAGHFGLSNHGST